MEGLDGVKRIQGFAPVGGVAGDELFVAAGRPSEAVFADPTHDLRRFLLLALSASCSRSRSAYLATKLLLQRWTSGVVDAARRFGAGDLTARAPVPRGLGDLTDVANALNSAAEDIERRQQEQAALLAELVAVEEETRRRVAADIHDDTAQAVAAAALRIDTLVSELTDPAAREVGANARQALAEANQAPPPAAVRAAAAGARRGGARGRARAVPQRRLRPRRVRHGASTTGSSRSPAPETRAILYRVALEALTNVRKHARRALGRGAARAPRRGRGRARPRRRRAASTSRRRTPPRSPGTSASSRCASAPRPRAGASRSRARPAGARRSTSGCPSRTGRRL